MNAARAYWELKAEQIMDRVFEPVPLSAELDDLQQRSPGSADASIEVEVRPLRRWPSQRLLILSCAGIACLALATALGFAYAWRQLQQELRQERTIRLLEGIRELPPAPTTASAAAVPVPPVQPPEPQSVSEEPPPPPDQAWIQELARLDGPAPVGVAPLRVPLTGTLRTPAPLASPRATTGTSLGVAVPELLGVVQVPGRSGSAIFQVGRSAISISTGEAIGTSGWRLLSTSADSALIERGGATRRVSISSGL